MIAAAESQTETTKDHFTNPNTSTMSHAPAWTKAGGVTVQPGDPVLANIENDEVTGRFQCVVESVTYGEGAKVRIVADEHGNNVADIKQRVVTARLEDMTIRAADIDNPHTAPRRPAANAVPVRVGDIVMAWIEAEETSLFVCRVEAVTPNVAVLQILRDENYQFMTRLFRNMRVTALWQDVYVPASGPASNENANGAGNWCDRLRDIESECVRVRSEVEAIVPSDAPCQDEIKRFGDMMMEAECAVATIADNAESKRYETEGRVRANGSDTAQTRPAAQDGDERRPVPLQVGDTVEILYGGSGKDGVVVEVGRCGAFVRLTGGSDAGSVVGAPFDCIQTMTCGSAHLPSTSRRDETATTGKIESEADVESAKSAIQETSERYKLHSPKEVHSACLEAYKAFCMMDVGDETTPSGIERANDSKTVEVLLRQSLLMIRRIGSDKVREEARAAGFDI